MESVFAAELVVALRIFRLAILCPVLVALVILSNTPDRGQPSGTFASTAVALFRMPFISCPCYRLQSWPCSSYSCIWHAEMYRRTAAVRSATYDGASGYLELPFR
jgi:hypothetical protein